MKKLGFKIYIFCGVILLVICIFFQIMYKNGLVKFNFFGVEDVITINDISEYLEYEMIEYGNNLLNNKLWVDTHKDINTSFVNLYEIIKYEKFDNSIFDYIDCNYENTKLMIIFMDGEWILEPKLDCIMNKVGNVYYNEKRLEDLLINYSDRIFEYYRIKLDENKTILFTLEEMERLMEKLPDNDFSMFKENYDFNKSNVKVIINNGDINYNIELVKRDVK